MNIVRNVLEEFGKTVLASIHDAIVVRQRLSADLKHEIELRMQERTNNAYWSLGAKQVHRWDASAKEVKVQEAAHRQRIAAEEALAAGDGSLFMEDFIDDNHDE